ncbi:hypothetical protein GYMLUDRAFT_692209 [Collybiopsis luxurians FD-317 M1]|uniref:Uncharacterized protein n=1 Tax=Collybiopsis luxurians FD-317 M1 TaxID=944289 RepID=A0A0D0CSC9_9AGAR|nr:hypothetical protein GYMLUDRAFT_692209 [Collybiopsis luxurians FD-317 M1]
MILFTTRTTIENRIKKTLHRPARSEDVSLLSASLSAFFTASSTIASRSGRKQKARTVRERRKMKVARKPIWRERKGNEMWTDQEVNPRSWDSIDSLTLSPIFS